MGITIHPTAIVGLDAVLGDGCQVGPYSIIEDGARLGERNSIGPSCHITGSTTMGSGNRLMRGASLGGEPQSIGYRGEPTRLIIGDDNYFGENCVVHRGMEAASDTVIGNHLYLMSNTHIGHGCKLGDHIIQASNAILGGEVVVMDRVNMGGGAGVHQFARIGTLAMIGGITRANQDVLPFTILAGNEGLFGINRIGIRRSGLYPKNMDSLKEMYKRFAVRRQPLKEFQAWMAAQPEDPFIRVWMDFLATPSKRGYVRAQLRGGGADAGGEAGAE